MKDSHRCTETARTTCVSGPDIAANTAGAVAPGNRGTGVCVGMSADGVAFGRRRASMLAEVRPAQWGRRVTTRDAVAGLRGVLRSSGGVR